MLISSLIQVGLPLRVGRICLSLVLVLVLVACGSLGPVSGTSRSSDAQAQRPPALTGRAQTDPEVAQSRRTAAGASLYSRDPVQLGIEVSQVCHRTRDKDDQFLRTLVGDLYFSGVHPSAAVQALMEGDCGSDSAIVEEMVAQGGRDSLVALMRRVRALRSARQTRRLESAAAVGLARNVGVAAAESGGMRDEPSAYGMLYFPSGGAGGSLMSALALNRLYEDAVPGYGIYTFLLMGKGVESPRGEDAARYEELFRMIETYVSRSAEDEDEPSAKAHVLLVPVKADAAGRPLIDQAAAELSDLMRLQFSRELRDKGQPRLASKLANGAGPFLVSGLEPRLLPTKPGESRLVTDLSSIGPEYFYGVVDAYDQVIPESMRGRPESLTLIRQRLLKLPMRHAVDGQGADAKSWVFMLGPLAEGQIAHRPSMS